MIKEPYQDLRIRTKKFALAIISLYGTLPNTTVAQVLGKQVLRSGTSAGSRYWEAQRAKSDADLINKMEGALQVSKTSNPAKNNLSSFRLHPSSFPL